MKLKKCSRCNIEKPVSEFYKRKHGSKDGLMSLCKCCKNKKTKIYREKNPDKINAIARKYYNEKIKPFRKKIPRKKLPDEELKRRIDLREKSKNVLSYRKEYRRRKDVRDRYNKARRENKERSKRVAKSMRDRRKNDPAFAIRNRMTCMINSGLRNGKQGESWLKILPYTLDELMSHIEKQFLDGMTWSNIGEWHIDHIMPSSSFNFESVSDDDFFACWHITNLRPMWAFDNISKGNKIETLL